MVETKHASQQHNLKPSISTWRERLPNKYELILMRDDVVTWCSHMFAVMKGAFSWSDAPPSLVHDAMGARCTCLTAAHNATQPS